MEENSANGTNYISLQPFIHQVGGHSSLLCLDEETICKPVIDREQLFYETIPESLKSFVPVYYGIVKVRLIQDGDYITLSATTPANYKLKPSENLKQLRVRRNGSIEVDSLSEEMVFDASDVSASLNPWVLKCHKEYITHLTSRMEDMQGPLKFIVLENLTWRFRLPCILDLKMGTRQYGDNDTLEKRQSKMVKVISTTSAKLGVRIAGMQVYQASSGRFLCRNKLYGRTLTTAGFQNAVRNFLHDGTRLRTDALPPLIRRLEELRNVLTGLDSLRLYTTSLLLLYEGHRSINSNEVAGPGQQTTEQSGTETRATRASSEDRLLSPPSPDFRCRSVSCNPRDRKPPVGVVGEEPLTDVRIIDFAHSTHATMDDKVIYSGPDNGFLLGLNNMIQLLKSILADPPSN
ncbi:inositol hexakisphosphate kinase 1-like isoform X2 [Macrosteles quadrilineatus]|uniref:inositol hexakisphosphate kinase 1-like isoform X2 n=1 Tax=Macrosteles quadrilineatus TaxID=74068 RepID=UPI0023E14B4C|nr:inositol hexakisphosphate kinase 1-like isoform X2 [Macrosteles quadrilineatus]XP_054286736.1 inositol hexakisphosphate kinase 1-like isoform X2 [Macrosteles quadrilineatus]